MIHPVLRQSSRLDFQRLSRFLVVLLPLVLFGQLSAPANVPAQSGGDFVLPESFPSYGVRLGEPARNQEDEMFDRLVDHFVFEYLRFYPNRATNVGIHDFDGKLRPTTAADVEKFLGFIKGNGRRLQLIRTEDLTPQRQFDIAMLLSKMRGMALSLETVAPWKRNPGYYVGLVSGSVHSLLKRDFAPIANRVASLNERLTQVPGVFDDARANLTDPPRIYVEVAISQARGLVQFLRNEVPPQAERAGDRALMADFEESNGKAIAAAEAYAKWLENDVLPTAAGDFALGENVYQKKLLFEEMVDTPIEELLARAQTALTETQNEMRQAAEEIRPGLTAPEALALLAKDAPDADHLISATESGLGKIRDFVAAREIMTVPGKENLRVAATPIYRRSLTFASMDSPGVFEENADEAYYYVTPPDPSWPEQEQKDHLSQYNPYRLEIISIHEAYPGHYYQFLTLRNCGSVIRCLFGSRSNSEGWAHYCEQMMLEQGYGDGDPRYRLSQLDAALKRICRTIVGISLHTRGMSFEEAVSFFEKEGYLPRVNAEREARRGTSDPTYLAYTLGKWLILDLRQAFQQSAGAEFRLGRFHDEFLTYGRAPIPLIRRAMLEGSN